jgi:(1->4)-alpha-D-glucan 1-alpha-D-glucosylmutase
MPIPQTTYRIQFNSSFDFQKAQAVIPYLVRLGITTLYASPIFQARQGSSHGYDIVDPKELNPDLGSWNDFEKLLGDLKKYGMGWLQDIVPNHMAYDSENQMLMDVLENGLHSAFYNFFDIDWDNPYENISGRLLAPFLGVFYGEALERGEITLAFDKTGFSINYYQLKFPLRIETYPLVLSFKLSKIRRRLGEEHPDFIKLQEILSLLKTLPTGEKQSERTGKIKCIKEMLGELYTTNGEIKKHIDENILTYNGNKGHSESFKYLDKLLSKQLFRLSFWKVAAEEVNYRRFFNINDLISLKMEEGSVFTHAHSLIFNLIKKGVFSGLRIDHVDGLYDPANYLKKIRQESEDLYVIVEKILDYKETLPSNWPIQGTTGYDFLNYLNGIFCASKHHQELSRIYTSFTGLKMIYRDLRADNKRLIIGRLMAGDVDNLAHLMKRISSKDRHGVDITLYGLKRALVEVLTFFPVYRTYVSKENFSDADSIYIEAALKEARSHNPGLSYEFDFIENFLLLKFKQYFTEEDKKSWIHFTMKFQQFTGPLMAKGFEDTMLYVYNRLISLNEVGGNPYQCGVRLEAFHKFNHDRAECWPHTLNATSTHDTKRGEDTRTRINVLSEIPLEWEKQLVTWSKLNEDKKKIINGRGVPDKNDEYFLYQTLIGAFPFENGNDQDFIDRIKQYILKAIREAKRHTAWLKPDTVYEEAFLSFIESILKCSDDNQFLSKFIPFQKKIASYGIYTSLSQTLIKITSPGVPDFYQGTELWDLSLVDPDNRRPVDFEKREKHLDYILTKSTNDLGGLISELLTRKEDGMIKLLLIWRALSARNDNSKTFQKGSYTPLQVTGLWSDHIIAFARSYQEEWILTIAPRLLTSVVKSNEYPLGKEVWKDTRLELSENTPTVWKNIFTEECIMADKTLFIGDVLKQFPVALLIGGYDA